MTQNRRPVSPGGTPRRPGLQQTVGRPASRPAVQPARASARGRLPYDFWPLAVIGIVLIAACFLLQRYLPDVTQNQESGQMAMAEVHSSGPIRINELMSSNSATLADENGVTADWIEIANVGGSDVNLSGYKLAKGDKAANVFEFPDHVLAPGECVIVFADSTLGNDAGGEYHAPFKLSSTGGSLMLFSPSGTAIDTVNFPSLSSDMAYARQDATTWSTNPKATPGLLNTEENYQALHETVTGAGVEITEVVSSASQYGADENGICQDYFELHNTTGGAMDLGGWFVSDVMGQPIRWRLPDGFVLQPDEYRIVYASGLDRVDAEYPHTNFGLSSEGEAVLLADDRGRVVDCVEFGLLKTDQAWLKQGDGTWTTGTPTPGAANE